MCVIGNKVDLRGELPEGSCVSSLHGEKLAKVCYFIFFFFSISPSGKVFIQTPGV